jgi:hypothetical protein
MGGSRLNQDFVRGRIRTGRCHLRGTLALPSQYRRRWIAWARLFRRKGRRLVYPEDLAGECVP